MDCMNFFRTILLHIILAVVKIYTTIGICICSIFLPITRFYFDRKFISWYGMTINGPLKTDVQVKNARRFYTRSAIEGPIGFFETYQEGAWQVEDFYGMMHIMFSSRNICKSIPWWQKLLEHLNLQTASRVWSVGQEHYDKASPIVASMIDTNLQYTCGYWENAKDLDQAQIDKMDLIARKLMLKPGMRVLELGCGYGTLAHYLAKNYGVSVVACTISEEQAKYGVRIAKEQKLDVEIVLCDYRDFGAEDKKGKFDRVVSIGMLEHVGKYNYRHFFKICKNAVKDDGVVLVHTIGRGSVTFPYSEEWVCKYIFPYGSIPYYMDLAKSFEDLFLLEDWHNFSYDYYKTLCAWENKFELAWPSFKEEYGDKFYTMWKIYLDVSKAIFSSRGGQLYQIVLTPDGFSGGYHSQR